MTPLDPANIGKFVASALEKNLETKISKALVASENALALAAQSLETKKNELLKAHGSGRNKGTKRPLDLDEQEWPEKFIEYMKSEKEQERKDRIEKEQRDRMDTQERHTREERNQKLRYEDGQRTQENLLKMGRQMVSTFLGGRPIQYEGNPGQGSDSEKKYPADIEDWDRDDIFRYTSDKMNLSQLAEDFFSKGVDGLEVALYWSSERNAFDVDGFFDGLDLCVDSDGNNRDLRREKMKCSLHFAKACKSRKP